MRNARTRDAYCFADAALTNVEGRAFATDRGGDTRFAYVEFQPFGNFERFSETEWHIIFPFF